MCHRAFDILVDTAACIRENSKKTHCSTTGQVALHLGIGNTHPDHFFEMTPVADIINFIIVLSCMKPCVTNEMAKVCSTGSASTVLPKVYRAALNFVAFASLQKPSTRLEPWPLQRSRQLSDHTEDGENGGSSILCEGESWNFDGLMSLES
jgi:hypothetical protein